MGTRVGLTLTVLGLAIGAFLAVRGCDGESIAPGLDRQRAAESTTAAREPAERVRPRSDEGEPASAADVVRESVAARVLRLVDLHSTSPCVGIDLSLTPPAGAAVSVRTGADGTFRVPEPAGGTRIAPLDTKLRVVPESVDPGAVRAGETLYLCRVLRVRGRVTRAGRPSELLRKARIVVASCERVGSEWSSSQDRVGSPAWLAAYAPSLATGKGRAGKDGTFSCDVIDGPEMSLVAHLPGYAAAVVSVDRTSAVDGECVVDVELAELPAIRLRVQDEVGVPIAGAVAQCLSDRSGRYADVNPHVEFLIRDVTDGAFVSTSSSATNVARVGHLVESPPSGADGVAVIAVSVPGDRRTVVVRAPRCEPFVGSVPSPAADGVAVVALRRFTPRVTAYRLEFGGAPVPNASISLAEAGADALTPAMPTITSGADGELATDWIQPGKAYRVTITRSGTGERFVGELTFGDAPAVEISGLRRE